MPIIVAKFGKPEDITNPGFDGKVFRFPVALIESDDIGTPRQPSKTTPVRIRAEVSDSRIQAWSLGSTSLIKVVFEIVKEYLIAALKSGAWKDSDLVVRIDMTTHKGACPFDPLLIREPEGAFVEIEVKRPIGFI